MKNDWTSEDISEAWSNAVGEYGDVFQRFIIKPYIAAALKALDEGGPAQTSKYFYDILSRALALTLESEKKTRSIDRYLDCIENVLDSTLSSLTKKYRILDLGGGEGFLGRWLSSFCTAYNVIDVSLSLITTGQHRSSTSGKVVNFWIGDLETIHTDKSLESWLRDCQPAEGNDCSDNEIAEPYDLIICTNVVDHVQNLSTTLSAIAEFSGRLVNKPLLVFSTLNPEFFAPIKDVQKLLSETPSSDNALLCARMGPANKDVNVITRPWQCVEETFSNAKLNVLCMDHAHISQYADVVQEEFIRRAGLSHAPTGGPFVLWAMQSACAGEAITKTELRELISESDIFRALSRGQVQLLEDNVQDIHKLKISPHETIAYPSNLPHGFYLILKGDAHLLNKSGRRQAFTTGSAFGELETGKDMFVSRFLYPIVAGENGCELVRVDRKLFSRLIEYGETKSIGNALFELLRDRVSTYSWVYHRATYSSKNSISVCNKQLKDRDCESLARILLFAATMEGGCLGKSLGAPTSNDGLSVFVRLPDMQNAISNEYSNAPEDNSTKSNNSPYKHAVNLFHSIGVIDAFNVVDRTTSNSDAKRDSSESYKRIHLASLEHILISELKRAAPEQSPKIDALKEELLNNISVDGLPTFTATDLLWSTIEDQVVRSKRYDQLILSAATKKMAQALDRALIGRFGGVVITESVYRAVERYVFNLAFLKNDFYLGKAPRFITINDMYFLRRVALGTPDWIDEIQNRAKTSPYVLQEDKGLIPYPQIDGNADGWRFQSYLHRFERHVINYWKDGLDFKYTHDAFLDEPGMVKQSLEKASSGMPAYMV